jgi:TRAP-type uncharacterized transport system fused permease subunit
MIIALSIILALTVLYLLAALVHIKAIQKELQALGKEQHTQNKDIIDLLKYRNESTEMLLEHIEILKYLCDKDPILSKTRKQYVGPVGEA